MAYNPQVHHRRSIRLKGYDYSQAGAYFITICCQDSICRFGQVVDGKMVLNAFGQIAYQEWVQLTKRFTNFEMDVFQIMPNHMHGIMVLTDPVWAGFTPAQTDQPQVGVDDQPQVGVDDQPQTNDQPSVGRLGQPQGFAPTVDMGQPNGFAPTVGMGQPNGIAPTVSDMVGAYKSLVANGCLEIWKSKYMDVNPMPMMGKLWQRNYYEHIIRDEPSYHRISEYILNNPAKWHEDKFYNL